MSSTLVFVLAIVGIGVLTAIAILAVATGRESSPDPGGDAPRDGG